MNEKRYMISDTSKQLEVEPHVLRYWEEELDMKIKRNEMGHRYYTEEDIRVLKTVRDMKNEGFQLKVIKQVLKDIYSDPQYNYIDLLERRDVMNREIMEDNHPKVVEMQPQSTYLSGTYPSEPLSPGTLTTPKTAGPVMTDELKMERFQEIMLKIIGKALENNQEALSMAITSGVSDQVSDRVSDKVSERVIKQMDYLMRENEEREEERYRKLDETIRQRQKANAEAAAALAEEGGRKRKKKRFGKREKVKPRILS